LCLEPNNAIRDRFAVNFIIVKHTLFSYERQFGSFFFQKLTEVTLQCRKQVLGRRARVVLPTPGGPQRIIECSCPDYQGRQVANLIDASGSVRDRFPVAAAGRGDVCHVIVHGQVVVRDRKTLNINAPAVVDRVNKLTPAILASVARN
jgi:hypothetical protein